MTAGNRWPVSHTSALPSSLDNQDQDGENDHTQSASRADTLRGTPVESLGGVTSSQRPPLPPPPLSPANTTVTTSIRLPQDHRSLVALASHHHTNSFPYPPFPERQLPAFDLRQLGDVHRDPLPPMTLHTQPGAGVASSSDPRSPFSMEDPSSSSSTVPPHRNPSVTIDAYEQYHVRPSHVSQHQSAQSYSHSRPLHSTVHPAYRTPGYSHNTFHPEDILSRPSSSHDVNHLGISSLLHSGSTRDRERSGLGVPETRRDNHSTLMNAPRSPVGKANMPQHSCMIYESELKRKRYIDEPGADSMGRTRLPSLPGLSIAGTLPPPPGFASSHRGASPSPLPSPAHSHYQRDGPRTGYRLAGDDGGETDQLDMDLDGADGGDGQSGEGKNKEDARKEKNRDKQRRLRMRRANQLQTLETTVSTQESDIKRLSQQMHESDERLRHVQSIFFDWIEALETRLRELGEPDHAIMSMRDQRMGSLNVSLRESQRDLTSKDSSKLNPSGRHLQHANETTIDVHAPYSIGHVSRQPQTTDNLAVSRIPHESRSPVAISPYGRGTCERISSPSYVQQHSEQTESHCAMIARDLPPLSEPPLHHVHDPWRTNGRSEIDHTGTHPSRSVELNGSGKSVFGVDSRLSEGYRNITNDLRLEQEILARLEEQEVFDMPDAQITQLASTLVRQKQPSLIGDHGNQLDGDGRNHMRDGLSDSKTTLPWRNRYTMAQVLLLYRSLGILTRDHLESRDLQIKRRLALFSPQEQELWQHWVRTPDKDKRIELLQDPILQMYFISLEPSSDAIESELIPFLCDQLHEARLFGPAWSIESWEMTDSFRDRWARLWPQHLATASLADWRRKDGHIGAFPPEVILGLDPRSTLKRGHDINSLP